MGFWSGLLSVYATIRGGMTRQRESRKEGMAKRRAVNSLALAEGKGLRAWRWDGHRTKAHTKSEARAAFKAMLGLRRLPVGANVTLG
jgi:hypothetical protein